MSHIEVLYHGDIDAIPLRVQKLPVATELAKDAEGSWWHTARGRFVYVLGGIGAPRELTASEKSLLRALCLQEPKQSGVWIDGEFRELRMDKAKCPNCGVFWYTHEPTDCDWKMLNHKGIWLSPPKAKEPLDEFEVQIAASIAIMSEKCSDDNDFARGAIDAYKDALKRHREFKEKQKNG